MISNDTLHKISGILPQEIVATQWERDPGKVALSVNGKVLATILPSVALNPSELPWLEYVLPENGSTAVYYLAYDLSHNSMFVVYKGVDIFIYEYYNITFSEFSSLLSASSVGASLKVVVKDKQYSRIATPTQLLTRLNSKLHATVEG